MKLWSTHNLNRITHLTYNQENLVPGRIREIQIQDFMCHSHVRLKFDVDNYNCFYIVGPNGSGKSAIFAAINMALGGAGRSNERGKKIQSYVKEGARLLFLLIV